MGVAQQACEVRAGVVVGTGVAQQACEVRAGVVVGTECWRMHCVTFGVVECFIFIEIGCGLPVGFWWSVSVL